MKTPRVLFFFVVLWAVAWPQGPLPLQERMKAWKLKVKHPDARYLRPEGAFPEVDSKPHLYKFGEGAVVLEVTGPEAWRPDPSAQVDELKAQLAEQARLLRLLEPAGIENP